MRLVLRLLVVASSLTAGACATRAEVFTPGGDITRPVLVSQVRLYYTQDALNARIEGAFCSNV